MSSKLLVKNLAFQATSSDLKTLFKAFGSIKKIRMPKKNQSSEHRGFGFVEFISKDEAMNAFKNLQNSHLYGRKLVIEWAKPEEDDLAALHDKAQREEDLMKGEVKGSSKRQKAELE